MFKFGAKLSKKDKTIQTNFHSFSLFLNKKPFKDV
jgi:hypothetical protein